MYGSDCVTTKYLLMVSNPSGLTLIKDPHQRGATIPIAFENCSKICLTTHSGAQENVECWHPLRGGPESSRLTSGPVFPYHLHYVGLSVIEPIHEQPRYYVDSVMQGSKNPQDIAWKDSYNISS